MKMTKSILILSFILPLLIGCASSGGQQADLPDGTILISEWEILALAEMQFGDGELGFQGKVYKFKISGVGAGGAGAQKINAVGHVYNLKRLADFPGSYTEARAGITAVKGVGGFILENKKGVVIKLKVHGEGLALAIGADGMNIDMK